MGEVFEGSLEGSLVVVGAQSDSCTHIHIYVALEYTPDLLHLDAGQDLSLGLEDAIGQGIAQHVSQFELRALNKQTACNKKGKERKV